MSELNPHKPWMVIRYDVSKKTVEDVSHFEKPEGGVNYIKFCLETERDFFSPVEVHKQTETYIHYTNGKGREYTIELKPR